MVTPFQVLWDTGASHSILSPAAARRLGFAVHESPDGHGTMKVANGASTSIYGWTSAIRVKPPRHLQASDGSRARVTALSPLRCLVADISEDVIVGFDYIIPLQGGFAPLNASGWQPALPKGHPPSAYHSSGGHRGPPSTSSSTMAIRDLPSRPICAPPAASPLQRPPRLSTEGRALPPGRTDVKPLSSSSTPEQTHIWSLRWNRGCRTPCSPRKNCSPTGRPCTRLRSPRHLRTPDETPLGPRYRNDSRVCLPSPPRFHRTASSMAAST